MLVGISGNLGSGKTLTMTYLATRYFIENKKLFSNYGLKILPHERVYSIRDLNSIRSGVFLGDELWTWIDSRMSQKAVNKMTSLVLAKSRKRDLTIVWSAQLVGTIEKRIRLLTEKILFPECFPKNSDTIKFVKVHVCDRKLNPTGSFVFPAQPYFKFYDTNEEVMPPMEMYEDILKRRLDREEYMNLATGKIDIDDLVQSE